MTLPFVIEAGDSIRSELAAGERLLWAGAPPNGLRLRAQDLFLIPFSLMWGGFAVFWELSVLQKGAPGFFAVWGIPFVAMGVYITIGRFFVEAWQRRHTTYALTDQRVLIVSGVANRNVKSLTLSTLSDISVTEGRNGSGTISFGPTAGMYGFLAGTPWPGTRRYMPPSFDMIPDVRSVHEAIRSAQRNSQGEQRTSPISRV